MYTLRFAIVTPLSVMSELDKALESCKILSRKSQLKDANGNKKLERLFNLLRCPIFQDIYIKQRLSNHPNVKSFKIPESHEGNLQAAIQNLTGANPTLFFTNVAPTSILNKIGIQPKDQLLAIDQTIISDNTVLQKLLKTTNFAGKTLFITRASTLVNSISLNTLKSPEIELNHSYTMHGAEVGWLNEELELEIEKGDLLFESTSIGNHRSLTHLIRNGLPARFQAESDQAGYDPVMFSFVKKRDVLKFMENLYKKKYERFLIEECEKRGGFDFEKTRLGSTYVLKLLNDNQSSSRKKFAVVHDENYIPHIKLLEPFNGIPKNSLVLVYKARVLFPFPGSDLVNNIFCGQGEKNLVFAKLPMVNLETSFL